MKLIILPILFSLASIGFANRDKIMDQYNAAYPADPEKAAAIEECITQNPNFNRLDPDDRKHCYRNSVETQTVALAPSAAAPSPAYQFSPSHLPGNDIRRQEANAEFHFAAPVAAPIHVAAYHPQAHFAQAAYRH
jgi:hypothetical protein